MTKRLIIEIDFSDMLESDKYCNQPAYIAIEEFEKAMDEKLEELSLEFGINILSENYDD